MTVIRFPRKPRRESRTRNQAATALPDDLLRAIVADLPGPADETEADRAARFEAQMAEVLSHNPRDAADVMLISQGMMMRQLAEQAARDASIAFADPAMRRGQSLSARKMEGFCRAVARALDTRRPAPTEPDSDPDPYTDPDPGIDLDPSTDIDLSTESEPRADPNSNPSADAEFLPPDLIAPLADRSPMELILHLHPAPKLLQ